MKRFLFEYGTILIIGLLVLGFFGTLFCLEQKSFHTDNVYKTTVVSTRMNDTSFSYRFANGKTAKLKDVFPIGTKVQYQFCYTSTKWRWEKDFPKKTTGYWCRHKAIR